MIFGAVRGRGGPVEFLPLSGSCVPLIRFAFSDSCREVMRTMSRDNRFDQGRPAPFAPLSRGSRVAPGQNGLGPGFFIAAFPAGIAEPQHAKEKTHGPEICQ